MMDSLSHDDLFRLFVLEHQQAVMVHLGKMVHPGTGKIERNLEAARISIDLLGMLEAKTKGNLNPDEDRLLSQVLATLRLNFVEEARRPASEPHEGPLPGPHEEPSPGPQEQPPSEPRPESQEPESQQKGEGFQQQQESPSGEPQGG